MRVRVERTVDAKRRLVECATALGEVTVVWEDDVLPDPGDHDVELEIPSILEWGPEIWAEDEGPPAAESGRAIIAGTLRAFDEIGVAEIELPGGLLLVETLGEPPLGAVGQPVQLRPPRIHAHPYDL